MNAQLISSQIIGFLQNIRSSLEQQQVAAAQAITAKIDLLEDKIDAFGLEIDQVQADLANLLTEVLATKGISIEARDAALAAQAAAEANGLILTVIDGKVDAVKLDTESIITKVDAIDMELDLKASTADVDAARDAVLTQVAVAVAEAMKAQPRLGQVQAFADEIPVDYEVFTGLSTAIVDIYGTVLLTRRADGAATGQARKVFDATTRKIVYFDNARPFRFDVDTLLQTQGAVYPISFGTNSGRQIGAGSAGDGFVYYFGGTFNTGLLGANENRADVYRYNIAADTYTRVADMPVAGNYANVVWNPVAMKFYYTLNGRREIFSYDPVANTHAATGQILPSGAQLRVAFTVEADGNILIFARLGNNTSYVLRFDYVAQTITILGTSPVSFVGIDAALGNDGLINLWIFDSNTVIKYDPVGNVLLATSFATPHVSSSSLAVCVVQTAVGQPAYLFDVNQIHLYYPSTFSASAETVKWAKYVG